MKNLESNNSFKGISYNTYLNIKRLLFVSTITTGLLGPIVLDTNEPITALSGVTVTTCLGYILMNNSKVEEHTRDIKEIKNLYKEFIKNYNLLNEAFDLKDPIEIHTMYNYLVYKGYLSKDKSFEFSNEQLRDIKSIMGVNVLTGKGVCRHMSFMLSDILNDYDIEAMVLGVTAEDICINIKHLDEQKYTKQELIDWAYNQNVEEDALKDIIKVIECFDEIGDLKLEISREVEKEKNPIKKLTGNHAITYAYRDDKSYYLDPTQDRIYISNGKTLSDDSSLLTPKYHPSSIFNDRKTYKKLKERIDNNYPSLDKEEQNRIKLQTLDICNNNIDIFEHFYNDNKDLYNETSHKILSLKKRTSIYKK